MIKVDSSHLDEVEYDEKEQILKILFKNGQLYHYSKVPVLVFDSLLKAESAGQFFNKHVRSVFKYEKKDKITLS